MIVIRVLDPLSFYTLGDYKKTQENEHETKMRKDFVVAESSISSLVYVASAHLPSKHKTIEIAMKNIFRTKRKI